MYRVYFCQLFWWIPAQLISPHPDTVNAVLNWLASEGVKDLRISKNQDFIHFSATVQQAESLLHARFSTFVHLFSGRQIVRTLGPYSVPKAISHHFDFITGATGFPLEPKTRSQRDLKCRANLIWFSLKPIYPHAGGGVFHGRTCWSEEEIQRNCLGQPVS